MKFFATIIIFVLISAQASAVDLVCSVPAANVSRSVEPCEELRVSLRVRSADWSNNICVTQFLRIGLIEGERRSTRRTFTATVGSTVGAGVADFTGTWAKPTPAVCGDGTLDTEFNEACDDGNRTGGDGCSASCLIE